MATFVSVPIPSFDHLNYQVDLMLRIYRDGSRYEAELHAFDQTTRFDVDATDFDLRALNDQFHQQLQRFAMSAGPMRGMRLTDAGGTRAPASSAAGNLEQLAALGNNAFKKIFGRSTAANDLRALLTNQSGALLKVVSDDFFLPWELLYPGDPATGVDLEMFLGMRHVVSRQAVQQGASALAPPWIEIDERPPVGLLSNRRLAGVVGCELPYFDQLEVDRRITLVKLRDLNAAEAVKEIQELKRFLSDGLHVVHFACEVFYEREFPDHSRIELTHEFPVTLEDMIVHDFEFQRDSHPLVVLNACNTGHINPSYTAHVAGAFLKQGARGVVATECEVPDDLAVRFIEPLYERLLGGAALGTSMLETRLELYRQSGDASGLLYAMYAPPSLCLLTSAE